MFEDLVGISVEQSQRRFRSVIADEHKLSIQEGPVEAEEESNDDAEVWRKQRQLTPLSEEKFPEEILSV